MSSNETLTGSRSSQNFQYSGGDVVIVNYSHEDMIEILSGTIDGYSFDGGDLIFHIGDGSLTLKDMAGHAITVKDSSGETITKIYGTGYSAQQVIKNLVQAWNKTMLSGTAKLDESIKLCSHFNSIQEAIDQMVADCRAAGDADTFLRKYCGIILDNGDTGAISGWDAGGLFAKTGSGIIGETLTSLQHVPDYTDTTFTADDLTINISSTGDTLNATGKKVLDGLYNWWAEESVKLIEESYGFKLSGKVYFSLVPDATYWGQTSGNTIKINTGSTYFYGNDDYNGNGVDRAISHEFTHIFQKDFLGGWDYPQFLLEGFAELTHGLDDFRTSRIISLAGNADSLASYLDLNKGGTGDANYYAAGFMFYRYLAKQAADNYDSLSSYAWKDNCAIGGTSAAEFLTGNAKNLTIMAGDGNDTITAYGEEMKIYGEGGNDCIKSNGDNLLIAGGEGKNTISNGGMLVTINTAQGEDFISLGSNVTRFTVEGFGEDDTIKLRNVVKGLSIADGALVAGTVTIGGISSIATTGTFWKEISDGFAYVNETVAGADFSGSRIIYSSRADIEEIFTIAGVTSADWLAVDRKIVSVGASALNQSPVTVSNKYILALGDDVAKPEQFAAGWTLDGTTAIYNSSGVTAGYTLADNKISYDAGTDSKPLITVSGVTSTDWLALDGKFVSVGASALNQSPVTISDGYELALGGDVTQPEQIAASWTLDGTTAIYSSSGVTAGYKLADNQISYDAGTDSKPLITVSGVTSTDWLALDGKIVNVGASALNQSPVTISDGYELALGGDVTRSEKIFGGWSLADTIATYTNAATIAGYSLADNQISYVEASGGGSFTVSGVKSLEGLSLSGATVKVATSALSQSPVTISDGYELALGDDIARPEKATGWIFDGNAATYQSNFTTAGYSLADNQISYSEFTAGNDLLELDGMAAAPILENNVVKLTAENFADKKISIVKGRGYRFELGAGDYTDKIFSGSAKADSITSNGSNLEIIGGAGKDVFIYIGGNNLISDYAAEDKISVASDYQGFEVDGDDVIFDFGDDDSLRIAKGAGKAVNLNSAVNYYTADGILDSKQKSINLAANLESFSAAKYSKLVTIDGAATGTIEIFGNNKANKIIAGTGGATLNGSKGKDTLTGGDGADVFIYENNSGKDVVENYGAGDVISLASGATIKDVSIKSDKVVIKFKGGSMTVKDISDEEITFAQDDRETLFSNGVFINGDSLIGGKGNDTLWGGAGADVFVYKAGNGRDVIANYESGELLTILNRKGRAGEFKKATFSDDTLTLKIKGGGKITLTDVDAATAFNINGEIYHVSENTLAK